MDGVNFRRKRVIHAVHYWRVVARLPVTSLPVPGLIRRLTNWLNWQCHHSEIGIGRHLEGDVSSSYAARGAGSEHSPVRSKDRRVDKYPRAQQESSELPDGCNHRLLTRGPLSMQGLNPLPLKKVRSLSRTTCAARYSQGCRMRYAV